MDRIGPYALQALLGEGGMGQVWRAEGPDGPVALKTVRARHAGEAAALRREIGVLAGLSHPGVVRIVDHGERDGAPWYAMALVPGATLRAHWWPEEPRGSATWTEDTEDGDGDGARPGAPPMPAEALTLLRRLCGPLAWLHGEGVVHRDLKPENVIVRPDGQPVLLDFGVLDRFGAAERVDTAVGPAGTLVYMAPEQAAGAAVDPRADLWALGCVLFEALTGEVPFRATTLAGLRRAHAAGAPLEAAPAAARPLLAALLARDPGDRLGSAEAAAAGLVALGAADEPLPGPPARPWLHRPRFVGRDAELAALRARLPRSGDDRAGRVVVLGQSGAGKSRLLREAAARAVADGVRVVSAGCLEGGGAEVTIALLDQVVDHLVAAGRAPAALGPHAAALAPLLPRLRPFAGGAPAPDGGALSARVGAVLAAAGPLALVIDDLQWADALLLASLRALAGIPGPVAVLAAARAEEVGPGLAGLLDGPWIDHLPLGRLDETAVGDVARDLLGAADAPRPLARALAEASDGNPFYVAEVLRAAVDDGSLRRRPDGGWSGLDAVAAGVPSLPRSLPALVARRLAGLSGPARDLARHLAVVGRETPTALVPALDGLPELLRRQVITSEATGLRFAHDKLREAVLADLPAEAARALHARVAEDLACLGDPSAASVVAHHLERAGERARARAAWEDAARVAASRNAQAEAGAAYGRAADLAEDDAARVALLRRAVDVGGADVVSGSVFARAERLVALSPTPEDAARLLFAAAQTARFAELADTLAPRWLPVLGRTAGSLRARAHVGMALHRLGRLAEARAFLDDAVALAESLGDPDGLRGARAALALHVDEVGGPRDGRRGYEASLADARAAGDTRAVMVALHNIGVSSVTLGEFDRAVAALDEAAELARQERRTAMSSSVDLNLALAHRAAGRLADALTAATRGRALSPAVGDRRLAMLAAAIEAVVVAEIDPDGGRPRLERVVVELAEHGEPALEGATCAYLAGIRLRAGDAPGALAAALAALDHIGARDRYYRALASTAAAEARAALGEDVAADLAALRREVAALELGPESEVSRRVAALGRAGTRAASEP